VSATGVLAYLVGAGVVSQLAWVDRTGAQLASVGTEATHVSLMLSPDGTRVALGIREGSAADSRGSSDIWIVDLARGLRSRLTFGGGNEASAVWSPDGSSVAYGSNRTGTMNLYRRASSGGGGEEVVLANQVNKQPESWSPDGRFLLYEQDDDLWAVPLSGDRQPFPVVTTPFAEATARFSPDGGWIAYASSESGRFEVYVTPFPRGDGKWQVSVAGGLYPVWRRDGRELYYQQGDSIMAVPVNGTGASFEAGKPERLFQFARLPIAGAHYDADADGRRFLINRLPQQDAPPITLVVNWPALLRQ
jgi:Tol biopolymer transport system component